MQYQVQPNPSGGATIVPEIISTKALKRAAVRAGLPLKHFVRTLLPPPGTIIDSAATRWANVKGVKRVDPLPNIAPKTVTLARRMLKRDRRLAAKAAHERDLAQRKTEHDKMLRREFGDKAAAQIQAAIRVPEIFEPLSGRR